MSTYTQTDCLNISDWQIPAAGFRHGNEVEVPSPTATASPLPASPAAADGWRSRNLCRAFYVVIVLSLAQITLALQIQLPPFAFPAIISSLLGLVSSYMFFMASGSGELLQKKVRTVRSLWFCWHAMHLATSLATMPSWL